MAYFLQFIQQEMNAMKTDLISTLHGLYVLTKHGELGLYDEQRQFHVDADLSAALREHCMALLERYRQNGDRCRARIGFIHPTREARPWKSATFFFEEHTIRYLYPVGTANAPLTAFQRKNQSNSYFRAMEILINTRTQETQTMLYCPVLFDGNGTLDKYVKALGRLQQENDIDMPVVEVLNLVDGLPPVHRHAQLQTIETKLRAVLIERSKSTAATFTLLDTVRYGNEPTRSQHDWGDVKVREHRDVGITAGKLAQLHRIQRHEGVERWLEIPHRAINPTDLSRFVHFRDLNGGCLDVLAVHALVYTAPSGTALLEQGMTDKWNLYLLEGTLLLNTSDGKTVTVEGGCDKATAPVAFLKPRKYKVVTLTKVSFLWIHDAMLHAIREARGNVTTPVPKKNRALMSFS
ncbi:MAG TPA: hypothetical protein VJS66_07645 [Burkholderiales bacterium]|nr:hypothetical protein [Burkholderiales bacterium]